MKTIFHPEFDFGFNPHACQSCPGNCCSGESGYVWIQPDEGAKIAEFLGISSVDFYLNYTYRKDNRVTLKETRNDENYQCVFFDSRQKNCQIYQARPRQCQSFPFWPWNQNKAQSLTETCPGIVLNGMDCLEGSQE